VTIPGPETVGERVARQRRRLKLGVRDLAAKADVAMGTVSRIEAGAPARGNTLEQIAGALGVSTEWLRTGKE
jgi:transcriptional regulator with XRE-family HTH domain